MYDVTEKSEFSRDKNRQKWDFLFIFIMVLFKLPLETFPIFLRQLHYCPKFKQLPINACHVFGHMKIKSDVSSLIFPFYLLILTTTSKQKIKQEKNE